MRYSLKTKMTLGFVIASLLVIALTFMVLRLIFKNEFSSYISEGNLIKDKEIAAYLNDILEQEGSLNSRDLNPLIHRGMSEGHFIILYDKSGKVTFKSMHQSMMGRDGMMRGHMGGSNPEGEYKENKYPLELNGELVGYVGISRSSGVLFSDQDIRFEHSLNRGLIVTSIISLILAFMIGIWIAGQLASPITTLKNVANQLQLGNLKVRAQVKTNANEIAELATSINHLGASLEKQESLRRRLTSDISHELRTPLNVLQAHLEALLDGIWEPTHQRINTCHSEVLRLTDLVKDLEKLLYFDDGHINLNQELVSLNSIIKEIVLFFEPKFHDKKVAIAFSSPQEIKAMLDKDKIRQVLFNIISNGYKFTRPKDRLDIYLKSEANNVIITITDTGIGIEPEDLPHIFERFYRGDLSRSRDSGGAGLGLAITQSIIKAHNGTIKASSQLGQGTTFTISLPIN